MRKYLNNIISRKNFKLVDEKMDLSGDNLYRIEAKRDIPIHGVKKGDLGGWVSSPKNIQGDGWVKGDAVVKGNAIVKDEAIVRHKAVVQDNAIVSGRSIVEDKVQVKNEALITDSARVRGFAVLKDQALVQDSAVVGDNVELSGTASVLGKGQVKNEASVFGSAIVTGSAIVGGDASVFGGAVIKDDAVVLDRAKVSGLAEISGNAKIFDRAEVSGRVVVKDYGRVVERAKAMGNAIVGGRNWISGDAEIKEDVKLLKGEFVVDQGILFKDGTINMMGLEDAKGIINEKSSFGERSEKESVVKGKDGVFRGSSVVKVDAGEIQDLMISGKMVYEKTSDKDFEIASVKKGDAIKGLLDKEGNKYISGVESKNILNDKNIKALTKVASGDIDYHRHEFKSAESIKGRRQIFTVGNLRKSSEELGLSFTVKGGRAFVDSKETSTQFVLNEGMGSAGNIDDNLAYYSGTKVKASVENEYFQEAVKGIHNEFSFSEHKDLIKEDLLNLSDLMDYVKEYKGDLNSNIELAVKEFQDRKIEFIETNFSDGLKDDTTRAINSLIKDNDLDIDKQVSLLGEYKEGEGVVVDGRSEVSLAQDLDDHNKKIMMNRFELTDIKMEFEGVDLYRIKAITDIPVHGVKEGDLGGWIEKESNLRGNGWVADEGKILGNGVVGGDAIVKDSATIMDKGRVEDDVVISGDSRINGRVTDRVQVQGDVYIDGSVVSGELKISDNVKILGNSTVNGTGDISGDVSVFASKIEGENNLSGNVVLYSGVNVSDSKLSGALHIGGGVEVHGKNIEGTGQEVFTQREVNSLVSQDKDKGMKF